MFCYGATHMSELKIIRGKKKSPPHVLKKKVIYHHSNR